jgi:DNA repair exonuclease SbcCD ATPase subunit/DNA repair exonuclease SbcCD nuclease subunit
MPKLTGRPIENDDDTNFDIFSVSESSSTSSKSSGSSSSSSANQKRNVSFVKLKDDTKTEITTIYHMADIHITAKLERHAEYTEAFDRTYKALKKHIGNQRSTSLIVIAGDLVHTKTEFNTEMIQFMGRFLKSLSKIADVILIQGNHDRNVANPKRVDAITPFVEMLEDSYPIYQLKSTGFYQYQNLVFGVTGILDTEVLEAHELSKEIFKTVKQKNKYKIALYHGPVNQCVTDVGYRLNDEITIDIFEGYNYALLGDTHKFQYLDENKTIAYSGSLIQQNFGETLDNHGFLKWDLLDGESELVQIQNDYGYCTLLVDNGKIYFEENDEIDLQFGKYGTSPSRILDMSDIPRRPRIRFGVKDSTELQMVELKKQLMQKYQVVSFVKDSKATTKSHRTAQIKKSGDNLHLVDTTLASQNKLISTYAKQKTYSETITRGLLDIHKAFRDQLHKDKEVPASAGPLDGHKWQILELRFSNTLSYGKDNVIDFRKYDQNKIIGIVAPNGYGKSAILEIILFCLFDKIVRSDRKDILNLKQKKMFCSLLFKIGSKEYLIERIGERSKSGSNVKIDVNFYCFTANDDGEEQMEKLNGLDKNDTNKRIAELIGDFNDYLTTCFYLQNGYQSKPSNFLFMTNLQKKVYLSEILKLDIFESCYKLAKTTTKDLLKNQNILEGVLSKQSLAAIKTKSSELRHEIIDLEARLEGLLDNLPGIELMVDNEISPLVTYDELSEFGKLNSVAAVTNAIQIVKTNQSKLVDDFPLETDLAQIEKQLEELGPNPNSEPAYMLCLETVSKIKSKIVPIPKSHKSVNLVELNTEFADLSDKILTFETKISDQNRETFDDAALKAITMEISDCRRQIQKPYEVSTSSDETILIDEFINWAQVTEQHILTQQISDEDFLRLQIEQPLRIEFVEHLTLVNTECNDIGISKIQTLTQDQLSHQQEEITCAEKLMQSRQLEKPSEPKLFDDAHRIALVAENIWIEHINAELESKIATLEIKHQNLLELRAQVAIKKDTIAQLALMRRQSDLLKKSIDEYHRIEAQIKSNAEYELELKNLESDLAEWKTKIEVYAEMYVELQTKIKTCNEIQSQQQDKINLRKKLAKQSELLESYLHKLNLWLFEKEFNEESNSDLREIKTEITQLETKLDIRRNEWLAIKAELEEYMTQRKAYDELCKNVEHHQIYMEMMHQNGLPYELLRTYIPLIESDVNDVLSAMPSVDFNVQFVMSDSDDQKKTNIGCIDVLLVKNETTMNVDAGCGFEKFVIGLAIRMTLSQISLTSKPNFLIIDEGWSDLDSENLGNIGTILDHIKSQYEHVIMISHLEALKAQSDYTINIGQEDGYSYVKEETIKHKKSKRRPKAVINV